MKNSNFDIYQEVTDRIIAQLEKAIRYIFNGKEQNEIQGAI